MNFYIIGSGILGLSIAEYFSRSHKNVSIISNENPLAGSNAAAANLATKGQQFARDPHFQLKLDSKKIYPTWIKNLIKEDNSYFKSENLEHIFKIGLGIDRFSNKTDRDLHLKRVQQSEEELNSKNLSNDFIVPQNDNEIIYKNEAWVHGENLLKLLKNVLIKRGIQFVYQNFSAQDFQNITNQEGSILLFCTGAWTKKLLTELNLQLPPGFKKSERMTLGSTFISKENFDSFSKQFVLIEPMSPGLKNKATLSGNNSTTFVSSSSVKIIHETDKQKLENENEVLLSIAHNEFPSKSPWEEKTGVRVGYGHREILIEQIDLENKNAKCIACCGAHKSGFLFAPVLGPEIEKLLSGITG